MIKNHKFALAVAAGMTAFLLALGGGLVAYLTAPNPAAVATTTAQSPADLVVQPASAAPEQDVQALLDQQDASYRQQLDEANRRLAEANARLQELYNQQAPAPAQQIQPQQEPPQVQQAAATSAAPYPVSAQMAASVALGSAPGSSLLKTPELVSFQGTPAYEVKLDQGTVYVDANSGQVLYNTVAASSNPAPSYNGHNDDEHDGQGEHHDDHGDDD